MQFQTTKPVTTTPITATANTKEDAVDSLIKLFNSDGRNVMVNRTYLAHLIHNALPLPLLTNLSLQLTGDARTYNFKLIQNDIEMRLYINTTAGNLIDGYTGGDEFIGAIPNLTFRDIANQK